LHPGARDAAEPDDAGSRPGATADDAGSSPGAIADDAGTVRGAATSEHTRPAGDAVLAAETGHAGRGEAAPPADAEATVRPARTGHAVTIAGAVSLHPGRAGHGTVSAHAGRGADAVDPEKNVVNVEPESPSDATSVLFGTKIAVRCALGPVLSWLNSTGGLAASAGAAVPTVATAVAPRAPARPATSARRETGHRPFSTASLPASEDFVMSLPPMSHT
jgi:hypothetical protein